jgi:hypothetical protein
MVTTVSCGDHNEPQEIVQTYLCVFICFLQFTDVLNVF